MVAEGNPRYFTIASGKARRAVYLTGSHIWNNLHDGMGPGSACPETPERFGEEMREDAKKYAELVRRTGAEYCVQVWPPSKERKFADPLPAKMRSG